MVLMDERQELLMMVTNSLKHDLSSRHGNIVGLALHALGYVPPWLAACRPFPPCPLDCPYP